jgi:hypothetical protein
LFIFFGVKENEPKENAHVTRPCGLPCASQRGRELWNSLALKQATTPFSPSSAMLGAQVEDFPPD